MEQMMKDIYVQLYKVDVQMNILQVGSMDRADGMF